MPDQVPFQPSVPVPEQDVNHYGDLAGGYEGSLDPFAAPISTASDLEGVRFHNRSVTKDFGWTSLGAPGLSRVLAIVEHRYITEGTVRSRVLRFVRSGAGILEAWAWSGGNWTLIASSVETVQDVMLSVVSVQGVVLIADGRMLLVLEEESNTEDRYNDFPFEWFSGVGSGTGPVAIIPDMAIQNEYNLYFKYRGLDTQLGTAISFVVGVYLNGNKVTEQNFGYLPSENGDVSEREGHIRLTQNVVAPGDTLELKLESVSSIVITAEGFSYTSAVFGRQDDGPVHYIAPKLAISQNAEAMDQKYRFHFNLIHNAGITYIVRFYYRLPAGAWTEVGPHFEITPAGSGTLSGQMFEFTIPGAIGGTDFGMSLEVVGDSLNPLRLQALEVRWSLGSDIELRGNSKDGMLDAHAGIEYARIIGGTNSVISRVGGAPDARLVYAFNDRALALRDSYDVQSLGASASGNVLEWAEEDTYLASLVSTSSDPIDDLTGFVQLSSGIGALFRKKSINRVLETGTEALPIAVVKWIEHMGTESPFSIQLVHKGAIFLGHDKQPYFLSEQGHVPIGRPIHTELLTSLSGQDMELVDSAYDSALQDYYMKLPDHTCWIFSVKRWNEEQVLVWRKRTIEAERLGVASTI